MNKQLQIGNSWTWNNLTFTVKKTESFLYNKSWLILVEGKSVNEIKKNNYFILYIDKKKKLCYDLSIIRRKEF